MTRTQRLQPVIQQQDKKEQKALQAVALRQQSANAEATKLQQLLEYKDEYLQQRNTAGDSCNALQLQEFSRFLTQLEQTIEAQTELVEIRQRELQQERKRWVETRIDSRKIHKVVENLEHEAMYEKERDEQREMDELSQRKRGTE
ncbi:MAG: flagellar export protein FliJ [Pseudomonadota bacterium]